MSREVADLLRLVVVTPVYNEASTLNHYVDEIRTVLLSRTDLNVRILLVDDGSSDTSWEIIGKLAGDRHFAAIRLSRNFGSHTAIAAGFDHVPDDADAVATLAVDLQDPPETILDFVAARRRGADIVWGARRTRDDGLGRRMASSVFDAILRRYAMPAGSQFRTGSFFLIDRRVLDSVRMMREHARVTFALVAWTGFTQTVVSYDRRARTGGRSRWRLTQLFSTAYDVFIGFSPLPAKILTKLGFVLCFGSLLTLLYVVATWITYDVQPGWTGLMATMILCFGFLFAMIGVSFEYLYRIFIESKDRPLYFVSQKFGSIHKRSLPDD